MYILFAFLGAVMAALGTLFAKIGLKGVDANLLTSIRGITMAVIVTIAALSLGKLSYESLATLSGKQWTFVLLSGVAGGLSWLFFYHALAFGPIVPVTVIDKFSIVLVAILAVLFLSEKITVQTGLGLIFITLGTLLVSIPFEKIAGLFK
jgi:transporter family protein